MKRSPSPSPARPSRSGRVLARVCLGAASLGLVLASQAGAQQAAAPSAGTGGIAASDLRLGTSGDLADDLRRPNDTPDRTLAPERDQTPYEPFGRGSEDAADRPDAFDPTTGEDAADRPVDPPEPAFDLFEGPDGAPARPANRASAPAAAGGAIADPLSGSATNGDAAPASRAVGAGDPAGPLIAADRRSLRSLSLAVPATTGSQRSERIGGQLNLPITGLRPAVPFTVDDAFAPVGIRAGSFVLYSTLEQSVGVSSNLSRDPGGASGAFGETQLSGRLLSNWSLHELEVNGLAAYRRNFAGEIEDEPRLTLDGRLRLDVDRLTTATFTAAIDYRKEDPIDLSTFELRSERPDILTYSAGADLERAFGRTQLGLTTTIARETTSATSQSTALDENYTTATAGLRAGYELSPALKPFVAGSIGRRVFDEEKTLAGIERDSVIPSLRTGVAFDLGEKFLGEVAVGYAWNVPDAGALDTTGSPTVDARVAWSPRRGTDVVFSAATRFDPDTVLATPSTLYEGAVALRHRATARTDLTAAISASYRDSDVTLQRETSYAGEAGFTYWLNRSLAFTGLVRHERLDSEAPGGDYTADSVRIGLRLQR